MPIYYVVLRSDPYMNQYQVWTIVKSFACDMADIEDLWRNEVQPLTYLGNATGMIFHREPENPFKEKAEDVVPGTPKGMQYE